MKRLLMGIDLGTSGCKGMLVDEAGGIVAEAHFPYLVQNPRTGWFEQDPQCWLEAGVCAMQAFSGYENAESTIAAIGLSGQMHGLVLLDGNHKLLRPCIIWADQRSEAQCREVLDKAGGLGGLLKLTNNGMLTSYTGGKLLWVRENEPELYAQARHALNPKDYLRLHLTGSVATDVSDASGTGLFDVENRAWSSRLLEVLEIDRGLMADCLESTQVAGTLTRDMAEKTGLRPGIPVIAGGGDALVQTIGSGLVAEKDVGITLGTGGQVCRALDRFRENPEGALQVFCHVIPHRWHAMGVMQSAGSILPWLKNILYLAEQKEYSEKEIFKLLDREAAQAPAGAGGLLFLPYLNGERCPHNDPSARGGFVGLTSAHRREHLARSVLEGIALGLKDIYALLDTGRQEEALYLSGGGASSGIWRQIFADVFARDIHTVNASSHGAAYGAALLAGVGIGVWPGVGESVAALELSSVTRPDPQASKTYSALLPVYQSLYHQLGPSFGPLNQIEGGISQ
ncbi:MAG: xylulokinase [Candidatus Limiplasma sp.]|nr:xylulokinase [Candidatus Limiplasma sp.]